MANTKFFECTVDWEGDNFEYDVGMAIGAIENNMTPLLEYMGGEMISDLQKHINDDVYKPYQPKSYPRRKDHTIFGIPLDDIKNFTTKVDNNLNYAILEMQYNPDGFHSGKMRDTLDYDAEAHEDDAKYANRPIKPHPVHGDALIRRLQTGEGYDWKCSPGPRPFWDNFVNEENNGKIISRFNTYIENHNMTNGKYDYTYKKATRRDLSFGAYDAVSYENMSEVTDYDDLPF